MKKKIVPNKRNVKKKNVKRKKYSGVAQWGAEFEKLAHRRPLQFNFIRPNGGINGDPFSCQGNEETVIHSAATRGELGAAPTHYSKGKFTPWEVIDDWKLDYYCGNAVKYVCRHKHKGKPVEDIQKAIDCLIKYKQNLEKETK
jgi:hypothetical protein